MALTGNETTAPLTVHVVSEILGGGARANVAVFGSADAAIERAQELHAVDGSKLFEVQVWATDGTLHGNRVVFVSSVPA